jgi:quinol monooxygenase YgiN
MAKEGKEEAAAELFRQLAAASRQEPGCALYIAQQHRDDPRRFLIYEQYRDDAALETHRNTAHFQQIARGSLLQVGGRLDGNLYTPLN